MDIKMGYLPPHLSSTLLPSSDYFGVFYCYFPFKQMYQTNQSEIQFFLCQSLPTCYFPRDSQTAVNTLYSFGGACTRVTIYIPFGSETCFLSLYPAGKIIVNSSVKLLYKTHPSACKPKKAVCPLDSQLYAELVHFCLAILAIWANFAHLDMMKQLPPARKAEEIHSRPNIVASLKTLGGSQKQCDSLILCPVDREKFKIIFSSVLLIGLLSCCPFLTVELISQHLILLTRAVSNTKLLGRALWNPHQKHGPQKVTLLSFRWSNHPPGPWHTTTFYCIPCTRCRQGKDAACDFELYSHSFIAFQCHPNSLIRCKMTGKIKETVTDWVKYLTWAISTLWNLYFKLSVG